VLLNDVKILEFEGLGPAPFAGMLLADLGAKVTVVNRPDGSPAPGVSDGSLLDRGKRSIILDLKNPDDIAKAKALAASQDAVIEGLRPGVMERLGLGPGDLQSVNSRLVYGRVTGWGQNGPLAQCAGHDLNYVGMSGAAWYGSLPENAPFTPPTLLGDVGGGALYLVIGILAALMEARRTGKGRVVDAAIYDGSAHMMNLLMVLAQSGALVQERGKSLLDGSHWSRTYETADRGYMAVQCLEPKFYRIFIEKMGLANDPRFFDQFDSGKWPSQSDILSGIFRSKPRAHWEGLFVGTDACVAPVLSPAAAAAHEMNQIRNTWYKRGESLEAAAAPRFSGLPEWLPPEIPTRGQHTDEILKEMCS